MWLEPDEPPHLQHVEHPVYRIRWPEHEREDLRLRADAPHDGAGAEQLAAFVALDARVAPAAREHGLERSPVAGVLAHEVAEFPIRDAHRFDAIRVHALFGRRAQDDLHPAAAWEVPGGSQWIGLLDEARDAPGERLVQPELAPEVGGPGAADASQRQQVD